MATESARWTGIAIKAAVFLITLISVQGCGGMNVTLLPETKPLAEQKIEGEGKPKILIIDLDGAISFKEESRGLFLTKPSKVAFFREALQKAKDDHEIAGVILRINSPGGTVAASDAIYHEVLRFRQKTKVPVYAYIMELGASGSYYVACSADRIIAAPSAIVGSIGVIAIKLDIDGLLSKIGVGTETYKSGPKKDFWSPFRPSTPEEKKMMQDIIDKLYGRFVTIVHDNRRALLSEQQVRELADGRVLTADDALQAKLIDDIAHLDETVEAMKKNLKVEQARVITYARPGTFKSNIYSEYGEPRISETNIINLISINTGDMPISSGVQFMYLWNP